MEATAVVYCLESGIKVKKLEKLFFVKKVCNKKYAKVKKREKGRGFIAPREVESSATTAVH